jgi:hypothetical protein
MSSIRVEVVRADRRGAKAVTVELPTGATVRDALRTSGMDGDAVGIFGKRVDPETRLSGGERIEIYRPLALDPKERRRQRARKRGKATRV